jgi:hypothetical protein
MNDLFAEVDTPQILIFAEVSWLQIKILLIFASQAAGIGGMSHCTQPFFTFTN